MPASLPYAAPATRPRLPRGLSEADHASQDHAGGVERGGGVRGLVLTGMVNFATPRGRQHLLL